MATFIEKYRESQTDISKWAPYCFFNNMDLGAQRFMFYIYRLIPRRAGPLLATEWRFQLSSMPIRLRGGRSPSVMPDYTSELITKDAHDDECRTHKRDYDADDHAKEKYIPRSRSQLFINLYVLFYHWAKYEPNDDTKKLVHNTTDGNDLTQTTPIGKISLHPSTFTLVTCFRDWARLFPLQFEDGSDWNPNDLIGHQRMEEEVTHDGDYLPHDLDMAQCMELDLQEVAEVLLSERDVPYKSFAFDAYPVPNTVNRNPLDVANPQAAAARRPLAQQMLHEAAVIAFGSGISTPSERQAVVARVLAENPPLQGLDNTTYNTFSDMRHPLPPRPGEPDDNIHSQEQAEQVLQQARRRIRHQKPFASTIQGAALDAMVGVSYAGDNAFASIVGPHLQPTKPSDLREPVDIAMIENAVPENMLLRVLEVPELRLRADSIFRIPLLLSDFTLRRVYRIRDRLLRVGNDSGHAVTVALADARVLAVRPYK